MSFLAPAFRYTRFVLLGKHTLWVFAVVLTLGLIATAWVNSSDTAGRITVTAGQGGAEPASMEKPRYQGLDSNNHPFNIIAQRATQPDQNTVILETLSADLTTENGSWAALKADKGIYHMPQKQLDLTGHVNLFYDGGYEFRTESAQVDVGNGIAWGNEPVQGQGPGGILRAKQFKLLDRGAILLFTNDVHVTLYLNQ